MWLKHLKIDIEKFFWLNRGLFWSFLAASILSLFHTSSLLSYFLVSSLIALSPHKLKATLLIGLCFSIWVFLSLPSNLPKEGLEGHWKLHINKVERKTNFFNTRWVYSGKLKTADSESKMTKPLPFSWYTSHQLPEVYSGLYMGFGTLKKVSPNLYLLKMDPKELCEPKNKKVSLAFWRYKLKNQYAKFIRKNVKGKEGAELLIGLTTGDLQNVYLKHTFSRFGLSHLLALSGFHFSILILFMHLGLFWVRSYHLKAFIIFIFLALFCAYIGPNVSLERSFLMVTMLMLVSVVKRASTALNQLGWAFCLSICMDPNMIYHLGFQFSYGTTFGILYFYPIICKCVPKGNKITSILFKLFALSASVQLLTIPLSLFHFHKFYWMGLLYNLCVPFFVGQLLMGLLGALTISLLSPNLGGKCIQLIGWFTQNLIDILYKIPTTYDYCWRIPHFSVETLIFLLLLFFLVPFGVQSLNELGWLSKRNFPLLFSKI